MLRALGLLEIKQAGSGKQPSFYLIFSEIFAFKTAGP
jgi:hypothetical protein